MNQPQRLCIDCIWYQAGTLPSGAVDKCTNPVFIELETNDLVRGNITRMGNGFCQELRKDIIACGPQASKWEPQQEKNNG